MPIALMLGALGLAQPSNVWLLNTGSGGPCADDLARCRRLFEQRGDAARLARDLAAVDGRPLSVELTDEGADTRYFRLPSRARAAVLELSYGEGGLGGQTWDAGIALAIWLSLAAGAEAVRGRRVLELGSGCGLGGVAARHAGASSVVLTDFGVGGEGSDAAAEDVDALQGKTFSVDALQAKAGNLQSNLAGTIRANAMSGSVSAAVLDWRDCLRPGYAPAETFDVVIGSDLVYYEEDAEPLAAAVVSHTAAGGTCYLMCRRGRPAGDRALAALVELLQARGSLEVEDLTIAHFWHGKELALLTFRSI